VIVAVTLARNGAAIGDIDLGYDTAGVVSINVRGEGTAAIATLAEVLGRDPGIAGVALTAGNPLFVRARDVAAAPLEGRVVHGTRYTFVSPEYFPLLRVPIERGRAFAAAEAASSARVAIVSASTAREFWPAGDPLGKTIRIEAADGRPVDDLPGYSTVTVVGVVRDVVSGMIVDGPDAGHIYLPAAAPDPHLTALLVRGRTPGQPAPEALDASFRQVVKDPQVFEALPLEEMRAVQMYPLRAASWVGSFLAAVALLLSIAGLYGVLSFTIGQRTREIGIRMALGATAAGVIRLVVRYSVRLAGVGALAGALTAFAVLSLLATAIRLRSVSVVDGVAFLAAIGVVLIATIAAAYQPARRATRVDPSQALRAEG
jgi:macrolide transport system ATP-binding/permease protein